MFYQVNRLANQTIDQAITVAETFVGVSRAAAEGTAKIMFKAKKPLRDAARTGVRLNRISHNSVEKLVKQQARALERSVDAGAARLELAARAPSLKALINEQVSLLPETKKRLGGDLRETWEIFVEAGSEIGTTLRPRKAAKSKPAKRKAKSARKAASKASPKATRRGAKKRVSASKAKTTKRAKSAKPAARRVSKKAATTARKTTRKAA
ncbi:MAG: TIGR01841 family phasin [Gammaproteobacteria bacterium]|nr:TIGR01841 family phasin [Gammaproteobacteria bacterium]